MSVSPVTSSRKAQHVDEEAIFHASSRFAAEQRSLLADAGCVCAHVPCGRKLQEVWGSDVLEWLTTVGGSPSPGPRSCDGPKKKFSEGKIALGHFWCSNFWIPDSSPSLPPLF